ncbi:hypothetical protein ACLK19_26855 [Escherichia coli]
MAGVKIANRELVAEGKLGATSAICWVSPRRLWHRPSSPRHPSGDHSRSDRSRRSRQRDELRGLKENVIVGHLNPGWYRLRVPPDRMRRRAGGELPLHRR